MKYLLFPISFLYNIITTIRNVLFDHKIGGYQPTLFDIHTISVGNLSVGGTGKTPMVEYLAKFLKDSYKVAIISRGYGRKTAGILLADSYSTPQTIGDEPMQYYQKFSPNVQIMVGEHRSIAIPNLLSIKPETQVILLDDAFQHRWVLPHLNILLTDYNRLFFKDYVVPMGRLRENRNGARRADVIIITKCPKNIAQKKENIKIKISPYITKSKIPIFFTTINYGQPLPIYNTNLKFKNKAQILLFTGIAHADQLNVYIKSNYNLVYTKTFADHHQYKLKDIENLIAIFDNCNAENTYFVTTEKDMVKLLQPNLAAIFNKHPVFYIPIDVKFLENENKFQKLILKGLK